MLLGASCVARPRAFAARPSLRVGTWLALSLLAVPSVGVAQERAAAEQRPSTHTVKKGDTLWDLAGRYLNDPFQWPEIYRINKDVVENPHWIYPGEVLKLPGAAPAVAEAPPELPAAAPAPRVPVTGGTVFSRLTEGRTPAMQYSDQAIEPPPPVRAGEILAAPWVEAHGGPRGAGRVLESAELRRGDRGGAYRGQLQLYEEVLFVPPAGAVLTEGARFLAFDHGENVRHVGGDLGDIMYPVAVLEVIRTPAAGEATIGRVMRLFSALRPGAGVIPFDSAMLSAGAEPTIRLGDAGPVTTIRWVWRDQPVPSLQSYLLLQAGQREGVRVGDRVTVFRPRTRGADERDPDTPALDIATAQVVRVTPRGSTAIVLGHKLPAIEVGMLARTTARVP